MFTLLSITAIVFYLLASYKLGADLVDMSSYETRPGKTFFYTFGCLAIILHTAVLYQNINSTAGFNLGFYNALSLMSWTVSLMVMIATISKPLENLGLVIFPVTALALVLELIFHSTRILPDSLPTGLRAHIILSICAYSLLTIATLQAIFLAIQDRQISNKHPAGIMRMPPMQIMEDLLIQIIAIGFFILSLSLATGLMFINDIFAQHLIHKTFLSVLAWLIFGILLWGRWAWGWRGKRAIRWTIGGFIALMLAYFGSKFVLELILHRV